MAKCKCGHPGCFYCVYGVDIIKTPKRKAVKKPKKAKKKEPPAKCGLCRRRLIPGDGAEHCMTCQHRMDNEGR